METIPPGVASRSASGRKKQRYFHDFFNYAGLHRSVWLYATPRSYVADISGGTAFDPGTGTGQVSYRIEAAGAGATSVRLRGAEGTGAAQGAGAGGGRAAAPGRPGSARRAGVSGWPSPGRTGVLRARGRGGRGRLDRRPPPLTWPRSASSSRGTATIPASSPGRSPTSGTPPSPPPGTILRR